MISVSGNKWSERKLNNRIIEKISLDNSLSYDLSKLILSRNYSLDEINELENEIQLNNPFFENKDFLKARNLLIKIIKKNLKKNTKIVIFVDCGSNSIEIINYLKKNKIEVLIIDHHHINNKLGATLNIINPMKNPKDYMGQNICAAALTFYLINLLNNKLKKKINIYDFLFFCTFRDYL